MNEGPSLTKSQQLYAEACQVLPGGISRNTIYRKPNPSYVSHGSGCRVTDVDGFERVDFANNMCSLIHGHAHAPTVSAVSQQLAKGTAFTLATEPELRFAQHLCNRNASFEKIRFMNSGTEAVMSGIKLARAVTGRPKIAKTEGAYHGTYDYAEVSQKAKPENWGDRDKPNCVPVANGTPQGALDDVVIFPFNQIDKTLELLDQNRDQLACVVLDLLPHRVGLIPAEQDYIEAIRHWTENNGALLMFDEVITFRMGYGGAADWYDVDADLTAMGKIIGGGFPVGALAGKEKYLTAMDPSQTILPLPHSGTFSANPITMTAGLATMTPFDQNSVERLNQLGEYARHQITDAIEQSGVTACVSGAGSMFRVHLRNEIPTEYRATYQDEQEVAQIKKLVAFLFDQGFMMINTCSGALSTAMEHAEIDDLATALKDGLKSI
ncbi:MAG: aspartate aminotransferase family protein [Planctomycetota bacterium]